MLFGKLYHRGNRKTIGAKKLFFAKKYGAYAPQPVKKSRSNSLSAGLQSCNPALPGSRVVDFACKIDSLQLLTASGWQKLKKLSRKSDRSHFFDTLRRIRACKRERMRRGCSVWTLFPAPLARGVPVGLRLRDRRFLRAAHAAAIRALMIPPAGGRDPRARFARSGARQRRRRNGRCKRGGAGRGGQRAKGFRLAAEESRRQKSGQQSGAGEPAPLAVHSCASSAAKSITAAPIPSRALNTSPSTSQPESVAKTDSRHIMTDATAGGVYFCATVCSV